MDFFRNLAALGGSSPPSATPTPAPGPSSPASTLPADPSGEDLHRRRMVLLRGVQTLLQRATNVHPMLISQAVEMISGSVLSATSDDIEDFRISLMSFADELISGV